MLVDVVVYREDLALGEWGDMPNEKYFLKIDPYEVSGLGTTEWLSDSHEKLFEFVHDAIGAWARSDLWRTTPTFTAPQPQFASKILFGQEIQDIV